MGGVVGGVLYRIERVDSGDFCCVTATFGLVIFYSKGKD